MSKKNTSAIVLGGILALAGWCSARVPVLRAQNKPAPASSSAAKLTEQEKRGEGFFLQRCSLCHLPRKLKFGSPPTIGPNLSGLFKMADPEQTALLRGMILKGSPNMPGFQYGLEPKEMDDLIAYLKIL